MSLYLWYQSIGAHPAVVGMRNSQPLVPIRIIAILRGGRQHPWLRFDHRLCLVLTSEEDVLLKERPKMQVRNKFAMLRARRLNEIQVHAGCCCICYENPNEDIWPSVTFLTFGRVIDFLHDITAALPPLGSVASISTPYGHTTKPITRSKKLIISSHTPIGLWRQCVFKTILHCHAKYPSSVIVLGNRVCMVPGGQAVCCRHRRLMKPESVRSMMGRKSRNPQNNHRF